VTFADAKTLEHTIGGRGHGRIDRSSSERITITVDEGSANLQVGEFSYALQSGETFLLRSGTVRVSTDVRTSDAFDEWVLSRSGVEETSESDRYVAPTVAG
jgi:hypothetical protein